MVSSHSLHWLIQNIWGTLLGLEIRQRESLPAGNGASRIVGRIEISGATEGAVALSCSVQTAREWTAALLQRDMRSVPEFFIDDCVGELVNIVGGQIKSFVDRPSTLSLPSVRRDPADEGTVPPGYELQHRIAYDAGPHAFEILCWEKTKPSVSPAPKEG